MIRYSFLVTFLIVFVLSSHSLAQPAVKKSVIQAGPMLGYSDMREVLIWVQTTQEARVWAEFKPLSEPNAAWRRTEAIQTKSEDGFTGKIRALNLEPGTRYEYIIVVNGKKVNARHRQQFQTQDLWQWRKDPPNFTVAAGSCFYVNDPPYDRPGQPYGSNYEILASLSKANPDMMLWLGDNIYMREVDWGSLSGMLYRYGHTRALPQLQPLLSSTHHYAAWDDHDFGPNDADASFSGSADARKAFSLFWANPYVGFEEGKGIATKIQWADVDFFLLDNRSYRSANKRKTGKRQMLGDDQIEWLLNALAYSNAPFKIIAIGGQTLNSVASFENYATFPEEREKLLAAIAAEQISGVIFLSGDRHHTVLSKMNREGTYPLYDLTVSPLTAGIYEIRDSEKNQYQVENTYYPNHNFALLNFSGPRNDRKMTINIISAQGTLVWQREILAKELR